VTFSFTWAFAQGSTSAPVRIYQKAAGDPSYPSTPTASLTLSGNAGNTEYTIAGISDAAYDYRVEIVDGSSTHVFFPAVTANIRLMDFDANSNAHIYGDLNTDGDVTDGAGNVLSDKADASHSHPSGTGGYAGLFTVAGRTAYPLFVYSTAPDEADLPVTPCFVLATSDYGLWYYDGN
jgi:hypothetical protein